MSPRRLPPPQTAAALAAGSAAQGQERGAGGLGVGGVASALVQLRHLCQRLGIRSTSDRAAPRSGGGGGITEGELRPPETDQRLRVARTQRQRLPERERGVVEAVHLSERF